MATTSLSGNDTFLLHLSLPGSFHLPFTPLLQGCNHNRSVISHYDACVLVRNKTGISLEQDMQYDETDKFILGEKLIGEV